MGDLEAPPPTTHELARGGWESGSPGLALEDVDTGQLHTRAPRMYWKHRDPVKTMGISGRMSLSFQFTNPLYKDKQQ